jgi:hypothetical protein
MSNETIEPLSFLQIHEEEITHIFWIFGIQFFSGLFVVNFCFICFNSVFCRVTLKVHAAGKIVKTMFYFVSVTSFAQTISSQNSVL